LPHSEANAASGIAWAFAHFLIATNCSKGAIFWGVAGGGEWREEVDKTQTVPQDSIKEQAPNRRIIVRQLRVIPKLS